MASPWPWDDVFHPRETSDGSLFHDGSSSEDETPESGLHHFTLLPETSVNKA